MKEVALPIYRFSTYVTYFLQMYNFIFKLQLKFSCNYWITNLTRQMNFSKKAKSITVFPTTAVFRERI